MVASIRPSCIWKHPPIFWVLLAVVTVLAGFAFQYTIIDMVYRWNTKEEYGYGYLIPVITLFLIWQRKNQLVEIEYKPSWVGILLMVLGGLLFFLGAVSTTHTLSQYGLVVTILGVALALLGWRAFRIVMAPLALLFFMVPLPP
ncbi:MAG: archaeosortase/exosortase family protein, partial [Gammaproteobacteria bacterium]